MVGLGIGLVSASGTGPSSLEKRRSHGVLDLIGLKKTRGSLMHFNDDDGDGGGDDTFIFSENRSCGAVRTRWYARPTGVEKRDDQRTNLGAVWTQIDAFNNDLTWKFVEEITKSTPLQSWDGSTRILSRLIL